MPWNIGVYLNFSPVVSHHVPMKMVISVDHPYDSDPGIAGDSPRQVPNCDMIIAQWDLRTPARHGMSYVLRLLSQRI